MSRKPADLDALGAQYREAVAALRTHRKAEVAADLAVMTWERAHRGVPSHLLYDRTTGEPTDPELIALTAARAKATADFLWCKAVVVASGEAYKGETFAAVVARNERNRRSVSDRRKVA